MSEIGLPEQQAREIVRRALTEDLPWGDVTSEAVIPRNISASGRFVAREPGVVCGLTVAALVFTEIDPSVSFRPCRIDGQHIDAGDTLTEIEGPARAILAGERTALNLLQRMICF